MGCQTQQKVAKHVMWPQWIGGLGALLLQLQIGILAGWTSPYVAQLTSDDSHMRITMTEASWVVSFLNLGRLIGGIIGSISVHYLGSKTTILVTCIPMALCWIFTMVANHVIWLYSSRMLGGIGLGMTYSSFSLYLGEIANPNIRGALVALSMSGLTIGMLAICSMGAYLPMEISGAVSLACCLVLMILFLWLPESPHHFVKKNLDEKAKSSIRWYHRDCDVEVELLALKKFVETYSSQSFFDTVKEFKSPPIKKAAIVTAFLFMYSQMCGLNNVLFYMEIILKNAHVHVIEPSTIVMIVMVFGLFASAISMFLIDRYGRRMLMIGAVFCVTVSLVALGSSYHLIHNGYDPEILQPLPIFSVTLFQIAVFLGILSVPSAVLGEIFPPHVKCVAACFGSISAGMFSFISSATYQPLINIFREEYTFYIYAAVIVTSIPFVLLFVPETKGKTLQEIQNELVEKA